MQDAEGQTLQFEYDAEGNRTGLLDANGVWTRWRYNSDDEATQKTYSDGSHESWSYNTYQGTLASSTNGRGQTTNYAYDAWQQLKTVDYPQSADVGLTYDALGRAQTMTDGLGTTTWGYDAVGRAAGEDGPWANDTVGYGYDSLDRLSGLSVGRTDGSADVTTLGYDSLSRVSGLSQNDGGTNIGAWSWAYNGVTDQVATQTNPNGTKALYGYEGANTLKRLTSVTNQAPSGATLSRFAYAYDTAGAGTSSGGATGFRDNRVAASKQYGSDAAQAQTTSYSYTDTSMLRGEGASLVSADLPAVSKSYGFDAMGNRTSWSDGIGKTQTNALYNRLNQIAATSSYNTASGAPVLSSTAAYGYDGDGNMTASAAKDASGTQVGASIYSYDEASRLVGIETPGQSKWQFIYDGLSRLRVSQVWSWQGGNWVPQPQQEIRRVYDGMDVVQERDANNNVVASYTRTGNIGGILARTTAASSTFYGYDLGGNVTTLTDNSGAQVGSYTYDAWGNTIASSGTRAAENPYRFSTKEALAGLYSYGLRFYASGLGRWINRDPIRESGGMNIYGFVDSNPTNTWDEYGEASWGAPGSGSAQECASLSIRIANIHKNIGRRQGDLRDNIGGLPERAPGDGAKPSLSRWGHRMMMNKDKALVAALEAEFAYKCTCKVRPPAVPYKIPQVGPVYGPPTLSEFNRIHGNGITQSSQGIRNWSIPTPSPQQEMSLGLGALLGLAAVGAGLAVAGR